jgi:glycosyltransferase involved in cell wall biosynthesis
MRILYSFPHKIGADRICYTAWQQVNRLVAAGVDVLAMPASLGRPLPVKAWPTLARGKWRIPIKPLGKYRAFRLHDYIVARRLERLAREIDLVHVWPSGALETIKTAKRLGIPVVLERPNAHTRYAYETVRAECVRIGVQLHPSDEYNYRPEVLEREEEEFRLADALLCPSDFVVKTFREQRFDPAKLLRHAYGFDETIYHPDSHRRRVNDGLRMLFVGGCAVRKGVHFALEAWSRSPAQENGTFEIAGQFLPAYVEKLRPLLKHPSVKVLGHRNDVPELMRQSDILVLPTLEEGSPLVVAEGMASGCVPLVSEVCTEMCSHMQNSLIHSIGEVDTLSRHLTLLHEDRALLQRLRDACIATRLQYTWTVATQKLVNAYQTALSRYKGESRVCELAGVEAGN